MIDRYMNENKYKSNVHDDMCSLYYEIDMKFVSHNLTFNKSFCFLHWNIQQSIIGVEVLAPCITKSSAAMYLTTCHVNICAFLGS